MSLLEVQNATKTFGGLVALHDVSLNIEQGEIRAIIGPNGAGKSTLFNVISAVIKPSNGRVLFRGEDITRCSTQAIARKGLVRTFQENILFGNLSVFDNLMIGSYLKRRGGIIGSLVGLPKAKAEDVLLAEHALNLLNVMGLRSFENELVSNLPHGYQRILGIAIALGSDPELLLLDEPLTGLNAKERETLVNLLISLKMDRKITIAIVEHNMREVMQMADKLTVLNYGKKIAEGVPKEIQENQQVISAYLGDSDPFSELETDLGSREAV